MIKGKRTNNDLQNISQKTKDRAPRTPLKSGGELIWSERVNSTCCICITRRVTFVTNLMISHERGKDQIVITIKWNICDTDIP